MCPVTVAVDAMGGDSAPGADAGSPLIELVEAPDVIGSSDEPAAAVRDRPNSSLVVACRLVREGRAGAALSAGSTGAMLAASLLQIGRIRRVHRPGIAAVLPARGGPTVLIDAGANPECRPVNLLQFGVMGSIFAER